MSAQAKAKVWAAHPDRGANAEWADMGAFTKRKLAVLKRDGFEIVIGERPSHAPVCAQEAHQLAAKHTPGPWIVDDRHVHPLNGLTYPRGVEPETDVIVVVDTDCHERGLINDTDRANLRLIAAAPALHAALAELLFLTEGIIGLDDTQQAAMAKARAVIAKAEGTQ